MSAQNSVIAISCEFRRRACDGRCSQQKIARDVQSQVQKNLLTFVVESSLDRDFGVTTCAAAIVIFFLTSFFNNSIHQLVAVKHHCNIFHEEWKGE